jgi:hypothetical protein
MKTLCSLGGRGLGVQSGDWVECPLLSIFVVNKRVVLRAVQELEGSCLVLVAVALSVSFSFYLT